jgi:hypothetical protein
MATYHNLRAFNGLGQRHHGGIWLGRPLGPSFGKIAPAWKKGVFRHASIAFLAPSAPAVRPDATSPKELAAIAL